MPIGGPVPGCTGSNSHSTRAHCESHGFQIRELSEEDIGERNCKVDCRREHRGVVSGPRRMGPSGARKPSIVVDPRRAEMKVILNARIKHREMFRPFAPSILEESVGEYFERSDPSPFMTFAYSVRPEKRSAIPAPTHVDGSGRLQTVSRSASPRYWRLIREFGNLSGVPVLLNTSFNDNEPIVCRPEEAINCFLRTRMDVLVLGNTLITKAAAGG